jgi:anaerobic selenocysteine-containing dehydrogenase
VIPQLIEELIALKGEAPPSTDDAYPFVLAAGERRTSTANTIYRDPAWRKKDRDGALRISPGDAGRLGVDTGSRVRVTTRRGTALATVETTRRGTALATVELFDRDSGQPVRPRVVDENTGIPIDVRRVRVGSRRRD